MKLADWMCDYCVNPKQLKRRLGVTNRSTVHRWIYGQRTPSNEYLLKIEDLTGGQVTLSDFLDPTPPKCAIVVELPNGKTKWILPWSRTSEEELESVHEPEDDHDEQSPPVRRALATLGLRAIELSQGIYRVDGRSTDTAGLIRAANQTLSRNGQEQISFPGVKKIGGDDGR